MPRRRTTAASHCHCAAANAAATAATFLSLKALCCRSSQAPVPAKRKQKPSDIKRHEEKKQRHEMAREAKRQQLRAWDED